MRKFLILLGILVLLAGGGYYYYSSRLQYLPDWYTESNSAKQLSKDIDPPNADPQNAPVEAPLQPPDRTISPNRIIRELKAGKGIRIDEAALSILLRNTVHQQIPPDSIDYLQDLRSRISSDQITVESVVALRHIPEKKLPGRLRSFMPMLVQMGSGDQAEVYVKVNGTPFLQDGTLHLNDDATLTVGKVVYALQDLLSLPVISQQMGDRQRLANIPYSSLLLEEGVIVLTP